MEKNILFNKTLLEPLYMDYKPIYFLGNMLLYQLFQILIIFLQIFFPKLL